MRNLNIDQRIDLCLILITLKMYLDRSSQRRRSLYVQQLCKNIVALSLSAFHLGVLAQDIDPALCTVTMCREADPTDCFDMASGSTISVMSDTPYKVTAQAVDTTGTTITSDTGTAFELEVELECAFNGSTLCATVATPDAVTGLPLFFDMTYTSNGQYEAVWQLDGTEGTVTMSVLQGPKSTGGVPGKFWTDSNPDNDPTPDYEGDDITELSFGGPDGFEALTEPIWQGGPMHGFGWTAEWEGNYYICPITNPPDPSVTIAKYSAYYYGSGELTIFGLDATYFTGQVRAQVTADGVVLNNLVTQDLNLKVGQSYPFKVTYKGGKLLVAKIASTVLHSGTGTGQEATCNGPNGAIAGQSLQPNRFFVSSQVWNLDIVRVSVPAQSTHDTFPAAALTAGNTASLSVNTKDSTGTPYTTVSDVVTCALEVLRPNAVVSEAVSCSITQLGAGSSDYTTSPTLTIAGDYTFQGTLNNDFTAANPTVSTDVGGPVTFTVNHSVVSAVDSTSSVVQPASGLAQVTAGDPFEVQVAVKDAYGNDQSGSMTGHTIVMQAVYNNHDAYESAVGVADLANWQTTYGTTHTGVQTDNGDGTVNAIFTIQRAGDYELSITIDGAHIVNSPLQFLRVTPSTLNASNSVPRQFQTVLTAGYESNFLIQGRDDYHNNVDSFQSGIAFTGTYTLQTDPLVVIEAILTSSEYPGVYSIQVWPDLAQEPGYYDTSISFGGVVIPTSQVKIGECINEVAAEQERIEQAHETFDVPEVVYRVNESGLMQIGLPLVPLYCVHTHAHPLMSAQVTLEGSSLPQKLSQVELEQVYGIEIFQGADNPRIEIKIRDLTLIGAVFDLIIDSTVLEEPTWANTSNVRIRLDGTPLDPFEDNLTQIAGAPRFDVTQKSEEFLSISTNEQGTDYFDQLNLNCNDQLSKKLPPITGEGRNGKFSISVDLGDASSFLSFNKAQRLLYSQALPKENIDKVFAAKITLRDKFQRKTVYRLLISYQCSVEEVVYLKDSFEVKDDGKFILPRIESINNNGEVKVKFDKPMNTTVAASESKRRLNEDDDPESIGLASSANSDFDQIHNSTVVVNGTSIAGIVIKLSPFDEPGVCNATLEFEWKTESYEQDEMTFQLDFKTPECVSASSSTGDVLSLTFNDQRLFQGANDRYVRYNTEVTKHVKRQMGFSTIEKGVLDAASTSASNAIVFASFFNILTNILLKASLSKLVNALKGLQIIVHILLIQVYMVAHAEAFLNELQKLISFGIVDTGFMVTETIDVVENDPLDVHFEAMGYETSDAILNLGPDFLFAVFSPLILIFFFLLSQCCWCSERLRTYGERQLSNACCNGVIMFFDASFLLLGVSSGINIYQTYKGNAEWNSSFYLSLTWAALSMPLVIALICFLNCKFKRLSRSALRDRVGAVYENFDLRNAGKSIFAFMFLSYLRMVLLSVTVTYGQESFVAQLLSMNFSTLIMIMYVATWPPMLNKRDNMLELLNEYTILVLYSICITQTDFVSQIRGRMVMGWALIVVICLNIAVNFGSILYENILALCKSLKMHYLRRKASKKAEKMLKKKAKIDAYRKEQLELQSYSSQSESSQVDVLKSIGDVESKIKTTPQQPRQVVMKINPAMPHKPQGKWLYNFTTKPSDIAAMGGEQEYHRQMAQRKVAIPYVDTNVMTPEHAQKYFGLQTIVLNKDYKRD